MARAYNADSISVIQADRDRIRKRPTMYIPTTGKEGAIHIAYEIVDNSIDEVTAEGSVGDTVTTIFDKKNKEFTIMDNGSGIPHEKLLEVCTVINSSGKFDNGENTAYQFSGGTNGVGLKLAVFLSEWCEVSSMREGKKLTYKFADGYLKDTITEKSKEHGTLIKFKLSQKCVDIKSVKTEDIIDRYAEKSYLFPTAKMELIIVDGDKKVGSYSYGKKDIQDRVSEWKPDTEIIRVTETRQVRILDNIDDDEIRKKKVIVDVAFAYKEDVLDGDPTDYIISYGNTIKTYTGGSHVDGLKEGIVKYFKKCVIPKLGKRDKDLPIMPADMTAGLCAFVVAKVYDPEFRGQYKDQLTNQEVKFAVRDAVCDALENAKPGAVNPMIEFVKRVTRGRMASKKTRKKDVSNAFSKDRIDKFRDVIYNLNTVEPELILVEGDSAANNAFDARDPNNQAIYSVKKPKNIFDDTTDHVNATKTVFNDILDICGIEPGKKCDPSKSTMRRILMLTDGDVDGDAIAISVVCLLAKHCRPLIDAGMVGRILPPAYSFPEGKKRVYVRSQREFFDKIMQRFVKEVKIGYKDEEFGKKTLYAFLDKNFYYGDKLDKLASRYCCDAKLLEYIATKYHGSFKDQSQSYWIKALKRYSDLRVLKETVVKSDSLIVIDGNIGDDYIHLAFDQHFDKHIKKLKDRQAENPSVEGYTINGEPDKTLYNIMAIFNKYRPKGVTRFKGLGELKPDALHDLCMDRDARTLAIFKFSDIPERDMRKIEIIMSTKKESAQARAKILMNMTADDLDIDT